MMKMMIKSFLATILVLAVSACDFANKVEPIRDAKFKEDLLTFNVNKIDIIDENNSNYQSNKAKDSLENINANLVNWAETRLKARGREGILEFVIEEAEFSKTNQDYKNESFFNSFGGEKTKYDAHYIIKLKYYRDKDKKDKVSEIKAESFSTRTVEGVISVEERQRLINELIQEVTDNLDKAVEREVKQRLDYLLF